MVPFGAMPTATLQPDLLGRDRSIIPGGSDGEESICLQCGRPGFYPCSVMSDSATPWTIAHQAPLSIGFSSQEYLSELPCHPPGDLPDPGIEPMSPALAGGFFTTRSSLLRDWFPCAGAVLSLAQTHRGCLTKSSACGRLWQFAHPRPLSPQQGLG